jgi:hypothetical protein
MKAGYLNGSLMRLVSGPHKFFSPIPGHHLKPQGGVAPPLLAQYYCFFQIVELLT